MPARPGRAASPGSPTLRSGRDKGAAAAAMPGFAGAIAQLPAVSHAVAFAETIAGLTRRKPLSLAAK